MKKKLPELIFIVAFFAICIIPSVGFLIFGPAEAAANERLATKPTLTDRDGSLNTAYLSQLSNYFADRFFLRQELISANNAASAALGSCIEDGVIIGSDGWLYYAETLEDYTGTAPLDSHDIHAAAKNLSLMQRHCEASGADFLFTIAPNKNSLYPENMPDFGVTAAESDAQRLFAACDELGVTYLDLFSAFSGQDETLYFAHDSHWNSRGAALAADRILAAFGRESSYFSGDFSASVPHSGDLFEMLFPAAADSEADPQLSPALDIEYEGSSRADSITLSVRGNGSGRLLAFRDSFGNLLHPYLADAFASSRFSRATAYDLTLSEGTDHVLIELVERNIDYLIRNIHSMPAPLCVEAAYEPSEAAVSCSSPASAPKGCILAQGRLDAPAGAVYIVCGSSVYEAFLLQDGGFAAYIPDGAEISCVGISRELSK